MIIRKFITAYKFFLWTFQGINIKKSIHSNIDMSVCAYNHGKSLNIGKVYLRSNVALNTEEKGVLIIGDEVFINRNSIISCHNRVEIGRGCVLGPNICIYDHDHNIGNRGVEAGYSLGSVIIEENCWIGAGTIILKGTHVGANSVIAAGCVVKGRIPSNSMVYNKRKIVIKSLDDKGVEKQLYGPKYKIIK